MSRALYHLSYGTAQAGRKPRALKKEILSCGLRPRLELALLRPPLGQGYSFPFVHALSRKWSEPATTGSAVGVQGVCGGRFAPASRLPLYSAPSPT
jgi:hypothetical protein